MKRIGYLVNNITKIGGTERAVNNIANLLSEDEEYDVFIISMFSKDNSLPGLSINEKVHLIHLGLDDNGRVELYKSYFSFVFRINKLVKERRIDILIGTTHAMNCLLTYCNKKAKHVGCEHTIYDACPNKSKRIRERRYPKLDAVVLLTQSDADHYTFVDQSNKYVIPNVMSFQATKPANLQSKVIIAAGRLTPVKRYDTLIEIAADCRKKLNDWEIRIFGEGECEKELRHRIEELNLHNFVKLMGNVDDIQHELCESSIMVMTSAYEGLPMVLIEGQSCGLPIVSFDCPEGPRNIIRDGIDGYLVPVDDKELFIECLCKLASDETMRRSFGESAFEASKKYSPERVVLLWRNLFQSL